MLLYCATAAIAGASSTSSWSSSNSSCYTEFFLDSVNKL